MKCDIGSNFLNFSYSDHRMAIQTCLTYSQITKMDVGRVAVHIIGWAFFLFLARKEAFQLLKKKGEIAKKGQSVYYLLIYTPNNSVPRFSLALTKIPFLLIVFRNPNQSISSFSGQASNSTASDRLLPPGDPSPTPLYIPHRFGRLIFILLIQTGSFPSFRHQFFTTIFLWPFFFFKFLFLS